jgi:hypothetical protein
LLSSTISPSSASTKPVNRLDLCMPPQFDTQILGQQNHLRVIPDGDARREPAIPLHAKRSWPTRSASTMWRRKSPP